MEGYISNLVESYERGKINRRQLIQGLIAIAIGAHAMSAQGSTFQGVEINHVALNVTSVERSKDFYQKLLGMPVISESSDFCSLELGRSWLALLENGKASLDSQNHYCIGIENYEVGAVRQQLSHQGLNPYQPVGSNRVYFRDPDGVLVQLIAAGTKP